MRKRAMKHSDNICFGTTGSMDSIHTGINYTTQAYLPQGLWNLGISRTSMGCNKQLLSPSLLGNSAYQGDHGRLKSL